MNSHDLFTARSRTAAFTVPSLERSLRQVDIAARRAARHMGNIGPERRRIEVLPEHPPATTCPLRPDPAPAAPDRAPADIPPQPAPAR